MNLKKYLIKPPTLMGQWSDVMTHARAAVERSIKSAMDNKLPQTNEELKIHLAEQLKFLKSSAGLYDNGDTSEAKRMAVTIRVLVHDTNKSTSLLKQLGLKDTKFFSSSMKLPKLGKNQIRVGSYSALIGYSVGTAHGVCIPYLDDTPTKDVTGYVDFDTYWNEIILIDGSGSHYSRKDIILLVADQDGGAHVDPSLDERYSKLSRQNSLGVVTGDGSGNWSSVRGAELASIRQIAHEIIRSLVPDYPPQNKLKKGNSIVMSGIGAILATLSPNQVKKVGRNDQCPCKSGKKYKRCHGA